jgi:hypothetical protein
MEGTLPSVMAPPRYLTVDELTKIVNVLPRPRAFNREIIELIREDIKAFLYHQLETEEISPDAIPILQKYIVMMFYRSIQSPGALVGITASEAVGGPTTQGTLKSFHTTGAAKNIPTGVEIAKELFNASPIRKREIIQYHFMNKNLNYEECMDERRNIIGITVSDIVVSSEFIDVATFNREWWYNMFEVIMDRPITDAVTFLRIKVDTTKLYGYKYTLADVAKAIEGNNDRAVKCIYSPTSVGIIDIYTDKNQMQTEIKKIKYIEKKRLGLVDDNIEIIFLQIFVLPLLDQVTIKGIKNIIEMYPVGVNSWAAIVQSEIKLGYNDKLQQIKQIQEEIPDIESQNVAIADLDHVWKIYIDMVKVRMSRVPLSKLVTLFEESGITIMSMPKDIDDTKWHPKGPYKYPLTPGLFVVHMDPTIIANLQLDPDDDRTKIKTPGQFISKLVALEDGQKKAWMTTEKRRGKLYPIWPDSNRYRASVYYYAECTGSNYKEPLRQTDGETAGSNYKAALRHPGVDPFRTTCNNPHYILANFDIEATRNACTIEFYDFITGVGSYINPRHLLLIPEFMNNLGFITAITSRGISRQNVGPYALASFEQPMKAFKTGMSMGRQEPVKSTSTCIMTAVKGRFGTNYFKTQLNLGLLAVADEAAKAFVKNKTLAPLALPTEGVSPATAARTVNLKKVDLGPTEMYMFQGEEINSDTLFEAEPEPAINFQRAPLSPRNMAKIVAPVVNTQPTTLFLCPKGPLPEIVTMDEAAMWLANIIATVKVVTLPNQVYVQRPMSPKQTVLANPGLPTLPTLNADLLLAQGAKATIANTNVIALDLDQTDWM